MPVIILILIAIIAIQSSQNSTKRQAIIYRLYLATFRSHSIICKLIKVIEEMKAAQEKPIKIKYGEAEQDIKKYRNSLLERIDTQIHQTKTHLKTQLPAIAITSQIINPGPVKEEVKSLIKFLFKFPHSQFIDLNPYPDNLQERYYKKFPLKDDITETHHINF